MDLSAILAELKSAQDEFKLSDKRFATAIFCQRACKVGIISVVLKADTFVFAILDKPFRTHTGS